MDALTVSGEIAPYITAAVTAYGAAVLSRAQDTAADATVSLGQRLLQRLVHRNEARPAVEVAVEDLAAEPADHDLQAALRVQLRKALLADPDLCAELSSMVRQSGPTIIASGERSIAAHTIHGGAYTGDAAAGTP
jgi:hypothetical protein